METVSIYFLQSVYLQITCIMVSGAVLEYHKTKKPANQ